MSVMPFGRTVWTTLEEKIAPQHTTLLVIDVQNHFCSPDSPLARESGARVEISRSILPPLAKLLDEARRVGVLVAYSRDLHRADGLSDSDAQLAFYLHRHKGDMHQGLTPVDGTWEGEICDEVKSHPQDHVFPKHQKPAFIGTTLETVLRNNHVRTTIVTGIATSGCVEATVRLAFYLGFYPVVPTDCVAEMHQDWHERALANLRWHLPSDSMPTSNTILDIWKGYPTAPRGASVPENAS